MVKALRELYAAILLVTTLRNATCLTASTHRAHLQVLGFLSLVALWNLVVDYRFDIDQLVCQNTICLALSNITNTKLR